MNAARHEFSGIVYFVYQPKPAPAEPFLPLLMIHGHGGDHRGMEFLAQALGITVIIPDLPGFGESKELTEKHTIERYVKSLQQLATHLEFGQYNVAGHSLGSAIALALAAEDKRVSKLVLLNPVPQFMAYIQYLLVKLNGLGNKIPPKYADALVKARLYNLTTFLLHSRKRADVTYAKQYLLNQKTARYSFKTWSESGESIYGLDQMALATSVSQSTLIVHGDKDSITTLASIEQFVAAFKTATLLRIAHAGHFLPLEHPADIAPQLLDFLKEDRV